MADVTVKQLAQVVGIPVDRLLTQLREAGMSFTSEDQTVNEEQKRILLTHVKKSTITLKRKSHSQVTIGHDIHSGKTVNIEVRKKKNLC